MQEDNTIEETSGLDRLNVVVDELLKIKSTLNTGEELPDMSNNEMSDVQKEQIAQALYTNQLAVANIDTMLEVLVNLDIEE